MRRWLLGFAFCLAAGSAVAQINFPTPNPAVNATGEVPMCPNSAGQYVACTQQTPLPVTGGIIVAIPGSPSSAQTGPNVVTVQGVNGMVPVATYSGSCAPNPITKITNPWPFCK